MLELVALVLSVIGIVGCGNRLRQISFRTTRHIVVLFYFAGGMWSFGILYFALKIDLEWYQMLGMLALLAALWGSRHRWKHGPPAGTTKPAPLGDPEVSGFQ